MLTSHGNIGQIGADGDDARVIALRRAGQAKAVAARADGAGAAHADAVGR